MINSTTENNYISTDEYEVVGEKENKQSDFDKAKKLFMNYKLKESIDIFEDLAKNEIIEANYYVGMMYLDRTHGQLKSSKEKARDYFFAGYNANEPLSSYRYALHFLDDKQEQEKVFSKVFVPIKNLAEDGDPIAQYELAMMYRRGHGTEKNEDEQLRWEKESADQGFYLAEFFLGMDYAEQERWQDAYNYSLKAAQKDVAYAEFNVGCLLDFDGDLEKNYNEAKKWYERAAKHNVSSAINNLGTIYREGQGCQKDINKAIELYNRAVELGVTKSAENLAEIYRYGVENVQIDYDKALKYYEKAEELGLDETENISEMREEEF